MTIWRVRIACWVTMARKTHSEYVTPTAFTLQQWLQEYASVLRHTYILCLSCLLKIYVLHFPIYEQLSSNAMCLP